MSGFVFPFDGMPRAAQFIAQVLPLTHFVEIVRGIVLRGAHLMDMKVQLAKLGVFFAVMLAASMLRFHKRLD
jgi:ABC-2 type transport system permease protein